MENKIENSSCKLVDGAVELSKLNLPTPIIKNICGFNYEKCSKCIWLGSVMEQVKNPERGTGINEYVYLFVKCQKFPDKEDLREKFQFSLNKTDSLRNIYRGIYNNDVDRIVYCCERTKLNYDNMIRDFNKVIQYMYENKDCRRPFMRYTEFIECQHFKLAELDEDND